MSAPLNRDQQIELMQNATERHRARMAAWLSDATVREVVCQPAPGQADHSHYMRNDTLVACCG